MPEIQYPLLSVLGMPIGCAILWRATFGRKGEAQ